MRKECVATVEEALIYITDCNLATVCNMASLKSRPKGEFRRQIAIAQSACDWIKRFNINAESTRAVDIIGKTTVENWAYQFMPKK